MNESINTSFLVMMVAILITIISVLMIAFFSYSRAYKTKNKMVDIIEKYNGYTNEAKKEIEQYLKDVGYNVRRTESSCPKYNGKTSIDHSSSYAYCVYKFSTKKKDSSTGKEYSSGYYYTVHIFVNINLPLINDFVELKVKGQSRTIYDI